MKGNAGLCRVLSGTLVYSGYCGVLGIMKGLGRVFYCQVLLGSAGSTWQYPAVHPPGWISESIHVLEVQKLGDLVITTSRIYFQNMVYK